MVVVGIVRGERGVGNYRVQQLFYDPHEVIEGVGGFLWYCVVYSVSVAIQLLGTL